MRLGTSFRRYDNELIMVLRPWAIHGASLFVADLADRFDAAIYWGAGTVAIIGLVIVILRVSRTR
jgi:hypothetical protein